MLCSGALVRGCIGGKVRGTGPPVLSDLVEPFYVRLQPLYGWPSCTSDIPLVEASAQPPDWPAVFAAVSFFYMSDFSQ